MRRSPGFRRWAWQTLHQFLGRKYAGVHWWTFMNYGYAAESDDAEPLALAPEDEQSRMCAQLYHHVTSAVDIAGREVLEVGCGRGGGSSYISRYLAPNHVTGLDIATSQIEFCHRVHGNTIIEFIAGSAENLPFDNDDSILWSISNRHSVTATCRSFSPRSIACSGPAAISCSPISGWLAKWRNCSRSWTSARLR